MVPMNVRTGVCPVRWGAMLVTVAMLSGILGCAPAAKREDSAAVRASIEAVNRQFMDAFSRRDAAALGLLYAEDGRVMPPGAAAIDGREAIAAMWQSVLALPIASMQLQTVEVGIGDGSAWETGRYTMTGNDGRTAEQGKYVVLWKHDEAGWKIYRDIWNSDAPAVAPQAGDTPTTP